MRVESRRSLTVCGSIGLWPGMQRVTLEGPDIETFCQSGIHLRLVLPKVGSGSDHVRYLTIRSVRPRTGQIDIDIVRHDGGRVSDWACSARRGEKVTVIDPVGAPDLPLAASYFLAADGSGLGAVARYLEGLHAGARGTVVVAAAPGMNLANGCLPRTGLSVLHLPPESFDARIQEVAVECMAADPPGFVMFAGEFEAARRLRDHVSRTLRMNRQQHGIVSYWRSAGQPAPTVGDMRFRVREPW